MKKKNEKIKTFLFKSNLPPSDFIAKAKDEAAQAGLNISESENCFVLKIGSKYYGEIFYSATVSAAESGSYISGEIITVPYDDKPTPKKKKTVFQKIMSVVGYIILSPLILLVVLYIAICELFQTIFHGKDIQPHEEKLIGFMKHNMQCKQKEAESMFVPCLQRNGSAYYEFQYCKKKGSPKRLANKGYRHWAKDSIVVHVGEGDAFFDSYLGYLECTNAPNGTTQFSECGVNYYTKEQARCMVDKIKEDKPKDFEVLIEWLAKAATDYNGFFFLGL